MKQIFKINTLLTRLWVSIDNKFGWSLKFKIKNNISNNKKQQEQHKIDNEIYFCTL